jgi:hypothetical protein
MSEIFTYICSKTTADPYIPPASANMDRFSRDVSDAFVALSGGHNVVGRLAFFPLQRSVPSHLLCDGREVPKIEYPELYGFLGDTQGTPADADNFVLPDFIGAAAFAPAPAAEVETQVGGEVQNDVPPTIPSTPQEWWYDYYTRGESGGRMPPY